MLLHAALVAYSMALQSALLHREYINELEVFKWTIERTFIASDLFSIIELNFLTSQGDQLYL